MALAPIPAELAVGHGGEQAARIAANMVETFVLHGGLQGTERILDIGCGPGRMASELARRFGDTLPAYRGFDIKRADIDWCKRNITRAHPRFIFKHLDIFNAHYNPEGALQPDEVRFPMAGTQADFIFATSVFTHMRTKEFLVYLREIKRNLSPGGTSFCTFFCIEPGFIGKMSGNRNFTVKVDEQCWTATPDMPEDVMGYDLEFVLGSYREAGLAPVFYRGAWSKLAAPTGRHSQDYVVARHA
jgi:SAM-dependent methyltransferase